MEIRRDERGLRKADRYGWTHVFVKPGTFDIIGGWYAKPEYAPWNIEVYATEDYRLMTSPMRKEVEAVTVEDWYGRVDFRKLLGVVNIRVDNL